MEDEIYCAKCRSAGDGQTRGIGSREAARTRDTGSKKASTRVSENSRLCRPKSRAKDALTGQCCRRVYSRINDLATCERIHKIGELPPQCSAVQTPTQSRTPAVDPQSSKRPP
jgi:hypothetical protein